ncbi:SNF2 family N-terminal domain-containing protein [Mycena olivaceomarginata]|nr:SNF2 family N-terminal domain-containing protein [Mycena olivaceomarginata]
MDPQRFISFRAPVFILDENEATKLAKGDPVKISPDPDHWMSWFDSNSDQPTPALIVRSNDSELAVGALTSYHNAPKLYVWMDNKESLEITIAATVAESSGHGSPEPLLAVNIEIFGPPKLFDLYLCRMLWAISDPVMRTLYALENAPQEPPPMWQVACLRDYGVKTRITADANWTNELDSLDMYIGTQARHLPEYPEPIPKLNTSLYPHQALQWALDQEKQKNPTENSPVQFEKVDPEKRGILADDMGLGKTLTMLALIMVTKPQEVPNFAKTTLIVAPLSVLSVWEKEIKSRCSSLTSETYHPAGRRRQKPLNFVDYDIIITNYNTLQQKDSPLQKVSWRRVILDEAHNIRNSKAKTHKAAVALNAHSRWALTGTPIVNTLQDIRSLLAFSRIMPAFGGGATLEGVYWFRSEQSLSGVQQQKLTDNLKIKSVEQKLLKCVCLHRTKEMRDRNGNKIIPLPKVTYRTIAVALDSAQQPRSKIVTVILRLRQAVMHPALVPAEYWAPLDREDMEDMEFLF